MSENVNNIPSTSDLLFTVDEAGVGGGVMDDRQQRSVKQWYLSRGREFYQANPHVSKKDIILYLSGLNENGVREDPTGAFIGMLDEKMCRSVANKILNAPLKKEKRKQIALRKDQKGYGRPKKKRDSKFTRIDYVAWAIHNAEKKYGKKLHPAARLFPYPQSSELQKRKDLYATQRPKVYVTVLGDLVLDGKVDMVIAAELDLDIEFQEYEGSDPVGFVLMRNLDMRSMNPTQKAMLAARLITTKHGDNRFTLESQKSDSKSFFTREMAAKFTGASLSMTDLAVEVLQSGRADIIYALESGKMRISKAISIIRGESTSKDVLIKFAVLDELAATKFLKRLKLDEREISDLIEFMKETEETCPVRLVREAVLRFRQSHKKNQESNVYQA